LVKAKGQLYRKPQHSHSSLTFHNADIGGNYTRTHAPNAFGGHFNSSETLISEAEDDKIVMDPRMPSKYALHAVFMQFATSVELKIDAFLGHESVCILSPICLDPVLIAFVKRPRSLASTFHMSRC
jgi:hypothetical protein